MNYKLKVEVLGRGEGKKSEVRILNKIVRHTKDGIELGADPRHAELVVKELEIKDAKPSAVPGTKESQKTAQSKTDEKDPEEMMSTATRARIELRNINNVQEARNSSGDNAWSDEELKYDGDEDEVEEKPLDAQQARLYRGVAARLNYIAPDRPDISYAVKEAARNMSCPKPADLRRLRKIGKYLLGQPQLNSLFKWQDAPTKITAFTDSDWAGCSRTARSTSGGAICMGEHVVKTRCKQQKVVARSSAEAQLYAMVGASAKTIAIAAYADDSGLSFGCELYCDSAAALGISQRAGIGKVRHLRTQGMWLQEVRVSGRIVYKKILGSKNPADLMTKHMTSELAHKHLETLNMSISGRRARTAPTIDSLVQAWYEGGPKRKDNRKLRFDSMVQYRKIPVVGLGKSVKEHGVDSGQKTKWVEMQEEHGQLKRPSIGEEDAEAPEFLNRIKSRLSHDFEVDNLTGRGAEVRRKTAEGRAEGVGEERRRRKSESLNSIEAERETAPGGPYRRCDDCRNSRWEEMDELPCLTCASSWNCWAAEVGAGESERRGRGRRGASTGKVCEPFGMKVGRPNAKDRVLLCPY